MPDEPTRRADWVLAAVELLGRAGRHGTVCVRGESMRPTLRPGQRLAVEFSPEAPRTGDLLLFRQGDQLLVHRLLGAARPLRGRRRLRTRGDGVPTLDPPLDLDRIVGRVVAVEDGAAWRSTRRRTARAYAWLLARHDLFWAAVGAIARAIDRRSARRPWVPRLCPLVAAVDRRLLRGVHRALFHFAHARVPRPVP
jgi:hypothetical protein